MSWKRSRNVETFHTLLTAILYGKEGLAYFGLLIPQEEPLVPIGYKTAPGGNQIMVPQLIITLLSKSGSWLPYKLKTIQITKA
jgi:hypothetical protein